MNRPRRVLWHSDAPWATSAYAGQTRLMARSLQTAGFEVVVSAAAGSEGGATRWEGVTVLPSPSNVPNALATWAEEIIDPSKGDVTITLVNTWRLAHEHISGQSILSWTPIDSDPAPPDDVAHFRATGTMAIAVSEFGADRLRAAGIAMATAIPHGIDTSVFRPLVTADRIASRTEARRQLGIEPDRFVVGVVAANTDARVNRKSLPEIVAAAGIHALRFGPTTLYLHSDTVGAPGGIDLRPLIQRTRERCGDMLQVTSTSAAALRRGVPDSDLTVLYNAFDVLCAPSRGEGFCLPLLEAQACGVPVIATDFAAQTENVGVGRLVRGQRWWDADRRVFLAAVSPLDIADALDDLRQLGQEGAADAREFAVARDHASVFRRHWVNLLGQGALS